MKHTHALFPILLAAALPLASVPAIADDDDLYYGGQLYLGFGSSPMVWVPEVGFYIAFGSPDPYLFYGGDYYYFDGRYWYRSRGHGMPWLRIGITLLPPPLRHFHHGDWPRYQRWAERRYRPDHRGRWPDLAPRWGYGDDRHPGLGRDRDDRRPDFDRDRRPDFDRDRRPDFDRGRHFDDDRSGERPGGRSERSERSRLGGDRPRDPGRGPERIERRDRDRD